MQRGPYSKRPWPVDDCAVSRPRALGRRDGQLQFSSARRAVRSAACGLQRESIHSRTYLGCFFCCPLRPAIASRTSGQVERRTASTACPSRRRPPWRPGPGLVEGPTRAPCMVRHLLRLPGPQMLSQALANGRRARDIRSERLRRGCMQPGGLPGCCLAACLAGGGPVEGQPGVHVTKASVAVPRNSTLRREEAGHTERCRAVVGSCHTAQSGCVSTDYGIIVYGLRSTPYGVESTLLNPEASTP